MTAQNRNRKRLTQTIFPPVLAIYNASITIWHVIVTPIVCLLTAYLPLCGATARWNRNKCFMWYIIVGVVSRRWLECVLCHWSPSFKRMLCSLIQHWRWKIDHELQTITPAWQLIMTGQ